MMGRESRTNLKACDYRDGKIKKIVKSKKLTERQKLSQLLHGMPIEQAVAEAVKKPDFMNELKFED